MADLRQAAQQALEVLKELQGGCTDSNDGTVEAITVWCPEVIADLEAALAEPEQEPDHKPDCALLRIPSRDCDCGAEPEPAK